MLNSPLSGQIKVSWQTVGLGRCCEFAHNKTGFVKLLYPVYRALICPSLGVKARTKRRNNGCYDV